MLNQPNNYWKLSKWLVTILMHAKTVRDTIQSPSCPRYENYDYFPLPDKFVFSFSMWKLCSSSMSEKLAKKQ